jgi:uncharacterized protein DUF5818
MKSSLIATGCIALLCLMLASVAAAAQAGAGAQPQGQGSTQQSETGQPSTPRTQSLSGSKTVEGCLERQGDGFAVRTEEGVYPLNTERDLTAYIGKRVRLQEQWDAKGTVTNSPIAGSEKAGTGEAAASAAPPGRPSAFSGDFRLHVEGSVIGDCTPTSK